MNGKKVHSPVKLSASPKSLLFQILSLTNEYVRVYPLYICLGQTNRYLDSGFSKCLYTLLSFHTYIKDFQESVYLVDSDTFFFFFFFFFFSFFLYFTFSV